ncbi:hypothetical protein GCM10009530_63150 [Microbispora corallina]|uniref:Uncharacterized protein n=1 Tax=Microbispora corallina TaxID=83302 RepID=A0ABQ4GBM5_9ACTN|nr:hypothetical protein [Microbispora corallina]GIH44455.1 hypothetical protein Mco01_74550 [Microbispora corallina]
MTIIPQNTAPALTTLAEYATRFSNDSGGAHLRTALLAALLAHRHGLEPEQAIDLARNDYFDGRVQDASAEADRLMAESRRRWQAAEYGEDDPAPAKSPYPGAYWGPVGMRDGSVEYAWTIDVDVDPDGHAQLMAYQFGRDALADGQVSRG